MLTQNGKKMWTMTVAGVFAGLSATGAWAGARSCDFNNDGRVNVPDLVTLRISLGVIASSGSPYQAYDLNGDGWVNAQDIVLFRSFWGGKPGPSGYVPSPP